ncbi:MULTISPECIES: hypothetical protein [unclassified Sphingomonas]|uniref:hypothetical protein n=1 Tax=unclassified Sphingomonas TaxID=196159 RepID=UPI000E109F15|nr:hypothetical protein [Sphingomonas sp. FARSPH]AXJ95907.1 hypothetical protein DM480_10675 [Sphingomonas sp. FARSPH]
MLIETGIFLLLMVIAAALFVWRRTVERRIRAQHRQRRAVREAEWEKMIRGCAAASDDRSPSHLH